MIKTLGWMRIAFLGLFVVLTAGFWVHYSLYVEPRQRCEAAGRWWSDDARQCGIPVSVSRFTGRPTPAEVEAARLRNLP